MEFRGSHILSVNQFTRADVHRLFQVANRMEPFAARKRRTHVLDGCVLGNLFFEPSTRSRISFGAAFNRLGGHVCDTTGFQFSSMAKGESLYDTSRVVSGYVDIVVVRHPVEGAVSEFAAATRIPVINGGDGPGEHPTQALLDLYTIKKELGRDELHGLEVAMVGDLRYGRTVHSLSKLLSLFDDISLTLISPTELRMPPDVISHCRQRGVRVCETTELSKGISNADVLYATRIQQERFTNESDADKYRGSFVINKQLLHEHCRPDIVVMHPLPRDSRAGAQELSDDLNRTPNLAIFRQTDSGIPVRMALFALVLGVQDEIEKSAETVEWYVPDRIGVDDWIDGSA